MNKKAKLSVTIALVLFVLSFGYILIQNISADPVITAGSVEPINPIVIRSMPSFYSQGNPLIVNLTMTLTKESCGVAYIEHIPVGWIPKDLPKDGAPLYNDKLSTITYAPIDGPFCQGDIIHDLSYTIVPSADAKGIQVFYSEFSVDGKSYPTDKDTIIDKDTASLDSSNQKTYNLATQEVTITNPTIDITPVEVAKAKLNSPIHNFVLVGDDTKFAQINLSLLIDYPSFFKSIKFIDILYPS